MSDIKQKAIEMFYKKFPKDVVVYKSMQETAQWTRYMAEISPNIKSVIYQIIDLAIEEERKRSALIKDNYKKRRYN